MTITVRVNNKEHQLPENTSVQSALDLLNIKQHGIAIAVNDSIIIKSSWSETVLKANDNVLLITATQGG